MTVQPSSTELVAGEIAPLVAADESPASATISAPSQTRMLLRVLLLVGLTAFIGANISAFYFQMLQRLYKEELQLSVSALGTLGILVNIPNYVQPFMGAWADLFPLFGFHRRSYYAVATLIEGLGLLGLSAFPHYHYAMVVCLVMIFLSGNVLMYVMVNAVMVATGNLTGRFGQIQSFLRFMPLLLAISYGSHLQGYVAQHWSYHLSFLCAAALCFLRIPCALLIDEKRVRRARHASETAEEHAARLAAKQAERAKTLAALRQAAASPGLWAIVGFVFYLILTPGINNAVYYYQKDVLRLTDQEIGDLGRWANMGTLIGILLFASTSRILPVRALVWGAWLMDCLSYPALLLMHPAATHQAVIAWAEIALFLNACIGILYGLFLNTLAARASPPGIEGAVYGLVLAAIALAGTLSEKFGATLYDYFGPQSHHSITHGWIWALWFGFGFTVIGAIFIPFLPAWARSREPIRPRTEAKEAVVAA